jgi:O-antigen/teichoic acid export membrane protein
MDKKSTKDTSSTLGSKGVHTWVNVLPTILRKRIEHRPNLQAILENSGWLLADRIVRMGLGLLMGIWIARYLGPTEFGLLNYCMALVYLFGAIAGLGLSGIVVRELVRLPDSANMTMGTAFSLQLVGGLVALIMTVATVSFARTDDNVAKLIVVILSFSMLFKAAEVVKFWFEACVKSKYVVFVENGTFFLFAIVKVVLIFGQASILAFALAMLAEVAIVSVFLMVLYAKMVQLPTKWRANFTHAKCLLKESWPLILVSSASLINMRMDQVVLGTMVSNTVVGNYAAAVRLAELWLVLPAIIGGSVFPALVLAKETNVELYRKRIRQITKLMAVTVLPVALLVSLLAHQIVDLVYGVQYAQAGDFLAIYIWTGVPYLVFFILNQMMYIEKLTKIALLVSIFAILSNMLFNFLLIPRFGGDGAAVAALITSSGSTVISLLILNYKTNIFWGQQKPYSEEQPKR